MNIGIICEYNPFHNGHLYQIEKIREEFGADTNIIAVMSGNFVQRGGVAIAEKGLRAKCAVLSGVNLVLELPFPFSMSSAEYFAKSAIHILDSLGCIDYVSFGSESGSIDTLTNTAELMLSDKFISRMQELSADTNMRKLGHAALCEIALKDSVSSENKIASLEPNNILALEYIKAIITLKSTMKVHTVQRAFNDISDESFVPGSIQSASAIRNSIEAKDISALEFVPNITKDIILEAISTGDFPCENEHLSTAIITSLRLNSSTSNLDIHDTAGGLYNRLYDLSFRANTIESFIRDAESKNFTKSRIRRALFYSLLGVTSSQFKSLPTYTQVLAMDSHGRAMLKKIGKQSHFPILTKPSNTDFLPDSAKLQKDLSDKADSIFQLSKPMPKDGKSALRFTPFVKL